MSPATLEPRDATGEPPPGRRLAPLLPEGPRSHSTVTRVGLLVASGVCFVLGIVFWLLPVVTGVPFYILALLALGMASPKAARWINRWERRLPHRFRRWLRLRLRRRERARRRAARRG